MRRRITLLSCFLALASPASAYAQDGLREQVERAPAPKLTQPPRLIKFVPARYPPEAQQQGIQGVVTLSIDLDAAGRVGAATVLESPHPLLAEAALAAVKQFRFAAAEVDGKPAPIRVRYAYNFVLQVSFAPRLPAWMEERGEHAATRAPLTGRVREQGSRLPLAGIAVAIPQLGLEVQSDPKGTFAFEKVPAGKYKVIAIPPSHRREEVEVEVRKGEQAVITFYLVPLSTNPYEIVVRGKRRQTTITRVTLRQQELTTVPGTFGDPVRVVENLPGVARVPLVGGALIIRGAAPQDSAVLLDGVKLPQIYHFLGGPSVLNPQFLDRIDYYPGNAEARYGRLTAGVIDVNTRSTFTRQLSGSLDVNLLNTSALLQVPITEKVSVAGAVRRSYIDAILPSVLELSERSATTVVPVYYDYQLRVDAKLKGDDQLFVLGFGSDDQLAIASNEHDEPVSVSLDSQITFHRVLAGWRAQLTDRLLSRLTPSFGFNYLVMKLGDFDIKLRTFNYGLREELEHKLSPAVTLRTGLDLEVEQGDFDCQVPLPRDYRNPGSGKEGDLTEDVHPLTISTVQLGLGAYLDALLKLTARLSIVPGVRFELFRYFGNTELSAEPRLTARYALTPRTQLKAAAGLFAQAPEPRETNGTFGNSDLNLEHAVHLSAGVEQQILPALSLDAQVYSLWRYDLAVPTDEVRMSGGTAKPLLYRNAGSAYSYGLELLLKHNLTRHFYGWLAYTLSRSLEQPEAGSSYELATFDQTHILTLVASVRFGQGWEVGTRFRLVSGRPEPALLGGTFDSDLNRYRRLINEGETTRLPLFHQLDLRVEKTWLFALWRLSAYLDVQNVYNATNAEATLYDYRFEQSAPLRGLPILPTLGIRGSF